MDIVVCKHLVCYSTICDHFIMHAFVLVRMHSLHNRISMYS